MRYIVIDSKTMLYSGNNADNYNDYKDNFVISEFQTRNEEGGKVSILYIE